MDINIHFAILYIFLQYPNMGICLTDKHPTWFSFYSMMSYFIDKNGLIVICSHVHYFYSSHTTYIKMCRLLLYHKMVVLLHHIRAYLWCHTIPNHCDVIIMSIVCCWCCHDTIVDVTNKNKILMATDGRSLHCGDLHRNVPRYNILVVPSQVMG